MSQKLRLYRGIRPNCERNTHYVFASASDYIAEIESKRVGAVLTLDNYRINNNVAKINAGATFEEIMHEISYIVVYDDETKYFRAYWVTSSALQSGFLILELNVDLWASSIIGAKFDEMHVVKCNRKIDEYMYFDDIKRPRAGNPVSIIPFRYGNLSLSEIAVIVKISWNGKQNVYGDDAITKTGLYYCTAQHIFDAVKGAVTSGGSPTGEYDNFAFLDKVADCIGGIYAVQGSYGGVLNAKALRLWLLPIGDLSASGYTALAPAVIKSKSLYSKGEDVALSFNALVPFDGAFYIDIATALTQGSVSNVYDFIASHDLIVGTPHNGFRPLRGINSHVKFRTSLQTDEIKISVGDGKNEKDISSAFEISLTTANDTPTFLSKMISTLGDALTQGINAGRSYEKGGVAGVALSGASSIAGALSKFADATPLAPTSNGDGTTSFIRPYYPNSMNSPYRITAIESCDDEIENAHFNGANVDAFISLLSEASNASLLLSTSWAFNGKAKAFGRTDETFIAIDEMRLEGVQTKASDYIKGEFRRGIFYKII